MFRVTTIEAGRYASTETSDVAGFCQRATGQVVRVERIAA